MRGIHWSPVNSQHKGQWRGALMFSLICVWRNGWVNNREVGDLRCHHTHYDDIVMLWANTLRLLQNGGHLEEDICTCILWNKDHGYCICFSMEFVPKGPTDNGSSLVQVRAWCQTGAKPFTSTKDDPFLWYITRRVNEPCWKTSYPDNFTLLCTPYLIQWWPSSQTFKS